MPGSPSPEVPEAMVEAGARALLDYESETVTFAGRDAELLRTITRHVLTAALRLDDPETPRPTCNGSRMVERLTGKPATVPLNVEWCPTCSPPVPPPASDPETVERVARALWASCWTDNAPRYPWERVSNRDHFRRQARAAICALLNTTDDEEAGERG